MEEQRRGRIWCIDWLRGIVMVLMALDHVRDYWGDIRLAPEDLSVTSPALFATRWVTHFCAPVFVLLAGTSAWLYGRKRSKRELAGFLFTRGLWLVVLELTVVRFAWVGTFVFPVWFVQVIAAIGAAMMVLSALVFLGQRAVTAIGLILVLGHNLLDPVQAADFGDQGALWMLLHQQGFVPLSALPLLSGDGFALLQYPLLPWIGVIALGFGLGPVFVLAPEERRRFLVRAGLATCAAFLVLRSIDLYGEPTPWETQASPAMTVVSFMNCTKYPPSLCYLLMTLGPALLALAALDREPKRIGRAFVVFGRVPLFFYVLHLLLITFSSQVYNWIRFGEPLNAIARVFEGFLPPIRSFPEDYGNGLGTVYLVWVLVCLALYLPCRWYAGVKTRSDSKLLSYL